MVTNFLLSILLTLGPEISIATNTLNPAIALDSNGAVVIWADSSTHATRLSSQSPEAAMQLDSGPYRDAGVASIGGESLAVWLRNDDLWGQRIGADGQPDGPPIYIAFTDSRHTQRFAVGASRDRYLVAWAISSRIVVSVIDANGQILAFAIPIINGEYGRNVEKIAVASTGDDFIVVWDASTSEPWSTPCQIGCPGEDRDVHSIVVRADGTPRGETEQVLGSGGEPDVATNGTDFLVAWSRFNGGISARAVGANGFPKDAAFTLTSGTDFGPRLVWDGSQFQLVFIGSGGLEVLRVNGGDPPSVIASGVVPRQFAVASLGGRVVIAYSRSGDLHARFSTAVTGKRRASRH